MTTIQHESALNYSTLHIVVCHCEFSVVLSPREAIPSAHSLEITSSVNKTVFS